MKQYLFTRLKTRWPVLPAAGIVGFFAILRDLHEGKAIGNIIIFFVGFTVCALLFPFRFGGEDWGK